jgi:hypothetical protein
MEALFLCYITAKFKLEDNLASMYFLTVRSEVIIDKKKQMNKLIKLTMDP